MKNTPYIAGFASFVPTGTITNKDLEALVDTSSEWIETRTGILSRHRIEENVSASSLGVNAAKQCLHNVGWSADTLTHIVSATCTSDFNCPPTACIIGRDLETKGQVCVDINAACTGFLTGLEMAYCFLAARPDARILLVANETLTRYCNWNDRSTCILFGDGAGAVVLTNTANELPALKAHLQDIILSSDGSHSHLLHFGGKLDKPTQSSPETPMGEEQFIYMDGRNVFKYAVRYMTDISQQLLKRNGLTIDDIDVLVPHQANSRIIEAVGTRLHIPSEKVFINVHKYGNTSAASIPIALTEATATGQVKKGDKVLLTSFGGGFTWGAALLTFE